jgi:hypothetical protein
MSKKEPFSHLLSFFPEVELPITIGLDTHHTFDANNKPLDEPAIALIRILTESTDDDELTEWVPCFKLLVPDQITGIVFWKAGLQFYEYHLLSFTQKGNLKGRALIAGTHFDEDSVSNRIAFINEEAIIFIAEGEMAKEDDYDPQNSAAFTIEILPDGSIVESEQSQTFS